MGKLILVTNISPYSTIEQLTSLFGNLGTITDIYLYPMKEPKDSLSKVGYMRFNSSEAAKSALHLNNIVFLDRAIIVLPLADHIQEFPEEAYTALIRAPANTSAGVPPRSLDWPLDVISMVVGKTGEQVIYTLEPRLASLGLPPYPALPVTTDASKVEEIRRTILVTNLDSKLKPEEIMAHFNEKAEVRCLRMAGSELDRSALIEFTEQPGVIVAFSLHNSILSGRKISVEHSNWAIIKPNALSTPDRLLYRERLSTSRLKSRSRSSHRRRSLSRESRRRASRSSTRKKRLRSRSSSRKRKRRGRKRSRSRSHRKSSRKRSLDGSKHRHDKKRKKHRRKSSRKREKRHHRNKSRERRHKHKHRVSGHKRRKREKDSSPSIPNNIDVAPQGDSVEPPSIVTKDKLNPSRSSSSSSESEVNEEKPINNVSNGNSLEENLLHTNENNGHESSSDSSSSSSSEDDDSDCNINEIIPITEYPITDSKD